ncbi:hypothetical protein NITGR_720005 [Nitrospina gracilis 3/211]|uniref:Uncharacterized protein n=1 Tax=Nitrospina gracilis (strain 3/211) TaxID=1266370 RepID=M1Z0K6_NITG3|nr:hypothetical protein NITGR_720005 [Nitrospina gracilis 3/211]
MKVKMALPNKIHQLFLASFGRAKWGKYDLTQAVDKT